MSHHKPPQATTSHHEPGISTGDSAARVSFKFHFLKNLPFAKVRAACAGCPGHRTNLSPGKPRSGVSGPARTPRLTEAALCLNLCPKAGNNTSREWVFHKLGALPRHLTLLSRRLSPNTVCVGNFARHGICSQGLQNLVKDTERNVVMKMQIQRSGLCVPGGDE